MKQKSVCLNLQTKTEHPYVEINSKIFNGSPVIAGTRVRIVDIAIECEYLNRTPDEIINAHPHLKLEQVHDALSYYMKTEKKWIRKLGLISDSFRSLPKLSFMLL